MLRRRHGIAANALGSLGTQVTSAAFTAALTLYLVRALGKDGYGAFGVAAAVGGLVLLPMDFGVSQASSRFIAEERARPESVAAIVGGALRVKLVISVGAGVVLFALAPAVAAAFGEDSLVWAVRAISISIVAQGFMNTFSYGLVALQRTTLNIPVYFVQSALETGLGIGLVAAGGGAAAALLGRAVGYVVATLLAAFLLRRQIRTRFALRSAAAREWSRRVFRYGGALVVVDSAFTLFNQVDTLLIGLLLDVRSVGLYAAPLRLVSFLAMPCTAVASAVAPRMAAAEGERPELAKLVAASQVVAYLQLAMAPPLLLWSTPIATTLLGGEFARSGAVLRALTPFIVLMGFGMLFSVSANYLGRARSRVPIALATAAINVVVDLIAIPLVGVVGGAIGTDFAYGFYAPAHVWVCRRAAGFPIRPLLVASARASVAAVAMAGGMILVAGTSPSVPAMLAGLAAGLPLYVLVLLLTGGGPILRRPFGGDVDLPGAR